jgi:hypothetical protein
MTVSPALFSCGVVGGGDPDALGGGAAQGDGTGYGGECEGLVVVAFEEAEPGSGTNAAGFEELEQAAIALINSADGVGGSGGGVGEQE